MVKRSACLGERAGDDVIGLAERRAELAGPPRRGPIHEPDEHRRPAAVAPSARAARRRVGPSATHTAEHDDAARLRTEIARLREVGRNLGGQIDEQVRKRPYVGLGAAAGVGFVAGSLLGSRLGQVLLAAGIGYAAKRVARR